MNSLVACTLILGSVLATHAARIPRDAPVLGSYGVDSVGQGPSYVEPSTGDIVPIISETNNAPGTLGDNSDFQNSFEAGNGIKQQSAGSTHLLGEDSVVTMKGSYEYVGEDGQTYVVDWIADENGFQPSAAHLPKEVPIPFSEIAEAVEAQIAFAAQEDANGGSQSFGSASEQVESVSPISSYGSV
ncbi:endocuticle structural glycoprotein SgAbd-3-like [Lepeophtheirus salmonis]|uniref:endocuticle structural glycoprotein SgAbd-3-like n=1 Tax=Lepeophtheirus salmonis TaxID=72036 RepID=UPI001AE920F9|nr:endocuticle structural glycoprotein SgAbd-9-like isoform X3 [Lepeophtheirus salmonis]